VTEKTITITLGEQSFQVPQFRLCELRDIGIGATLADPGKEIADIVKGNWERTCAILSAALIAKYPSMTPDVIMQIRASKEEVDKAIDEILIFAGLAAKKKDQPAGETEAGASTTST
jgi:hypothetical protein